MFKKTQKRLLKNYPILWNTKFVPMGITVLIFNIFFFIAGFYSGSINFHETTYDYQSIIIVLYLISVLASILILIIWLLFYFKNNGLKSFYPKKSNSIYIEWLLTFVLLIGNQLYPYSYFEGIQYKQRTYASKQQTYTAKKILNKIQVLLPNSYDYYQPNPIKNPIDSLENNSNSTFMHVSLLNFKTYYNDQKEDMEQVKNWLITEQKDSIRNLIQEYLDLQKKHNLSSNLTVNSWMNLVYNPPNYIVPQSNYISKTKTYYDDSTKHYVEFQNLRLAYKKILDAYNNGVFFNNFILTILYIALNLSIALLSYRTTSGKAWLTALVALGLLAFINGIISVVFQLFTINNHFFHIIDLTNIYWTLLFLFMFIQVLIKVYKKHAKNKTAIMINLILWILPFIPILYFNSFISSMSESTSSVNQNIYRKIYLYFCDHPTVFFWINLIFVIIILFFIAKIIKKWRALPEE